MVYKENNKTMKCLLVIDYQKGFTQKLDKQTKENIEYLIDQFSNTNNINNTEETYCILTKFINHENSSFTKYLNWHGMLSSKDALAIIE